MDHSLCVHRRVDGQSTALHGVQMVYDEGGLILWVCNPDHDDVVYCLGYSAHDMYRHVLSPIQELCREFLLEHRKGSLLSPDCVVGDVEPHA